VPDNKADAVPCERLQEINRSLAYMLRADEKIAAWPV
jgi:hypothetical protein